MHAMSFTKKLEASLDSDMIKLCEIWYVCNQRCLLQACHEYQGSVTVVCAILLEIAKKKSRDAFWGLSNVSINDLHSG